MAANSARGRSALSDIEIEEMLAKKQLNRSMFSRLVPLLGPVRYRVAAAIGLESGAGHHHFRSALVHPGGSR